MNREIKFKCWDYKNKQMFHPRHMTQVPKTGIWINSKNILLDIGCDTKEVNCKPCNDLNEPEENRQTYSLLQFTGLRDKNDKEIYEGDILKIIHSGAEIQKKYNKKELIKHGLVMWDDDGFKVKWNDILNCRLFKLLGGYIDINGVNHDSEVIGNKYQNQELLKNG